MSTEIVTQTTEYNYTVTSDHALQYYGKITIVPNTPLLVSTTLDKQFATIPMSMLLLLKLMVLY